MKGLLEEYGTFVASVIIGLCVLSFLLTSVMSPNGSLHKLVVLNMQSVGAVSQVVIEEWDVDDGIKAVLKDDGGLYLTGSGTLPAYASVEDTPWASEAGNIDFVKVEDGVIVSGEIPIR